MAESLKTFSVLQVRPGEGEAQSCLHIFIFTSNEELKIKREKSKQALKKKKPTTKNVWGFKIQVGFLELLCKSLIFNFVSRVFKGSHKKLVRY